MLYYTLYNRAAVWNGCVYVVFTDPAAQRQRVGWTPATLLLFLRVNFLKTCPSVFSFQYSNFWNYIFHFVPSACLSKPTNVSFYRVPSLLPFASSPLHESLLLLSPSPYPTPPPPFQSPILTSLSFQPLLFSFLFILSFFTSLLLLPPSLLSPLSSSFFLSSFPVYISACYPSHFACLPDTVASGWPSPSPHEF